jgi:MOSC domain-containing protein YiiM
MIPPKMGEIEAIWIKRFKHGPMDPVTEVVAAPGRGLKDNANQGGKRQITLIDAERWREVQEELGVDVDPRTRRANLMLRGIDLERTNGRELRLGECIVRIYGETRPCNQMEEAQPGLRAALSPRWRGGAFAEILTGGTIRVGDIAEWV